MKSNSALVLCVSICALLFSGCVNQAIHDSRRYVVPLGTPAAEIQFATIPMKTDGFPGRPHFCSEDEKIYPPEKKMITPLFGEYHIIKSQIPAEQDVVFGNTNSGTLYAGGVVMDFNCPSTSVSFYSENNKEYEAEFTSIRGSYKVDIQVYEKTSNGRKPVNQKVVSSDFCKIN